MGSVPALSKVQAMGWRWKTPLSLPSKQMYAPLHTVPIFFVNVDLVSFNYSQVFTSTAGSILSFYRQNLVHGNKKKQLTL